MSLISFGKIEDFSDVNTPPLTFDKFAAGVSPADFLAHTSDTSLHLPIDISAESGNQASLLADGLFVGWDVIDESDVAVAGAPLVQLVQHTDGSSLSVRITAPNGAVKEL